MSRANRIQELNKIAKRAPAKPSKSKFKEMSKDIYNLVLDNIEWASSEEGKKESYKMWEGHIGLNIGWAKNKVGLIKDIIMKSQNEPLTSEDKKELKLLIEEATEAFYYSLPIPLTHHKKEELEVFNDMNYQKACKCGETDDDDWYSKNCK